jgi:hypothetical protein
MSLAILIVALGVAIPDGALDVPPLIGWPAEYDAFVEVQVGTITSLVELRPRRVASLCPNWERLTRAERGSFFSNLLYAIAEQESGLHRDVMSLEKSLQNDRFTGRQVVSESLLQLSYQDMDYSGCRFDWRADRERFAEDWGGQDDDAFRLSENSMLKTWKAKHADRSIQMPRPHLTCAVAIVATLFEKHSNANLPEALGHYWSSIRQNKKFEVIRTRVQALQPGCSSGQ